MNEQVAKVSIVGAGMVNNPGVAARMFEALYGASVNINMISTSEIKVSVLVNERDADRAVRPSTTASSTNLEATPEQASKRCSPLMARSRAARGALFSGFRPFLPEKSFLACNICAGLVK